MCGILGTIALSVSEQTVRDALSTLNHRGPDASGVLRRDGALGPIFLAHTRLAILDTSDAANQPFIVNHGSLVIVFNGEIYNFEQLANSYLSNELLQTRSDTEVILLLYKKYGVDAFNLLEGMYSIAIFDEENRDIVLARDQYGIKPLYLYVDGSAVAFSSEVRALQALGITPAIDSKDLQEFLSLSFLLEPNTGFSNIKKLHPGSFLKIDCDTLEFETGFIRFLYEHEKSDRKPPKLMEEIQTSVIDSIKKHLISNVPVSNLFSGGVDSSIVAMVADPITNFTAVSPHQLLEQSSDIAAVRTLATKNSLVVVEVSLADYESVEKLLNDANRSVAIVEEPSSDLTILPIIELAAAIKKGNFKVVLNGTGADEVFWGYPKYKVFAAWKLLRKLRLNILIGRLIPNINNKARRLKTALATNDVSHFHRGISGYFSDHEVSCLTKNSYEYEPRSLAGEINFDSDALLKSLERDGFLSRNLLLLDKGTMSESIEGRVPYLNQVVEKVSEEVPAKLFFGITRTKDPLRQLLSRSIYQFVARRKKRAFHPSLGKTLGAIKFAELDQLIDEKVWKYLSRDAAIQFFITDKPPYLRRQQILLLLLWLNRYGN